MEKAQVGDLIRIVKVELGLGYEVGDILEVVRVAPDDSGVNADGPKKKNIPLFHSEFVIHRKAGEEEPQADAVSHPSHYTQGRFETIEMIEEVTQGYSDGYVSYCVGNALKYLARAPFKHESPAEDIAKARAYLDFAIKRLGGAEQ